MVTESSIVVRAGSIRFFPEIFEPKTPRTFDPVTRQHWFPIARFKFSRQYGEPIWRVIPCGRRTATSLHINVVNERRACEATRSAPDIVLSDGKKRGDRPQDCIAN